MALARSHQSHAAQNTVSGVVSNGATWYETVVLTDENGDPLTGVDGDLWEFRFRSDGDSDTADLTLTTADSTLTVTESTETTLQINVPATSLSNLVGDYVADLKSTAAVGGHITHRAHGVVTFRNDP